MVRKVPKLAREFYERRNRVVLVCDEGRERSAVCGAYGAAKPGPGAWLTVV
jgi:hypothetical protein